MDKMEIAEAGTPFEVALNSLRTYYDGAVADRDQAQREATQERAINNQLRSRVAQLEDERDDQPAFTDLRSDLICLWDWRTNHGEPLFAVGADVVTVRELLAGKRLHEVPGFEWVEGARAEDADEVEELARVMQHADAPEYDWDEINSHEMYRVLARAVIAHRVVRTNEETQG